MSKFSYFYDRLLEHNQVTKMLLPTTPPSKVEKSELHESPVLSASSSEEDLSTLENLEAEVQKLVDNTEREPEISQTVASPEVDVQASADEYEEDEDDYEDEDADVDHPSSVIPPRQDSLARSKSKRAPPSIITQKQLTQVKASAMEISAAHAAMRRHIAKEMVMSEQKYCNNLKLLCYEYADRIHAIPALSDKEKVALTGNVQEILIRHHALLSDLEEEVAGWNDTSAVSNIFRAHLPYLECYRTYMKTYPRIGLNVAYQSRFQPAVATVAQQFAVKAQMQGGLWLDSYLLMPIQRLPRIALMLRDMLKHTPPAWNDAGHLEQVLEALEDLLRSINAEIPTQNTASLKDMQGIIAFSETSGTDPLRVLTPESDLMAATPIEGYKIQRGLKSLASDDADFHRVVATTSGLLITTQKVEAQRKKAMARSKTAIIDGPRKLDIPWHAAWRECTLGLHGSTLLASSSVEAMGSIKAVFEDSEEAAAIFWALKNALGR